MKTKTLHSFNPYNIEQVDITIKDNPEPNQILVKSILTGVCRSDIMAYTRQENMPYYSENTPNGIIGTFGHEGLGIVQKVGTNISDVKPGDYVATLSDNAYADYYLAPYEEYVKVPALSQEYIIQPTACAINIIEKTLAYGKDNILLLGSGFMSIIIAQYYPNITVVGNSNQQYFENILSEIPNKKYSAIIDLTSKAENFYRLKDIADVETVICYAATPSKPVVTNFFENCWNCHTFIMPSPRNKDFRSMMEKTVNLIDAGIIDPKALWTKGYDFADFQNAFNDGVTRNKTYMRGYLIRE